jgi:hypothetical protein
MNALTRSLAVSTLLLSAGSCEWFHGTDCAGVGSYNFAVTVVDSLSGLPAAEGATLLTYDVDFGGYRVDSIVGQSNTDVLRGADRKGLYTVVVRKEGYRDWVKSNVRVEGDCTTQTVSLTAKMARP